MSYSHLNILVVEDNKINQLLVKNMLIKFGFPNFDVAENGGTALKLLSANNYDLILLDIQMPGMNGYEITNKIRTMNRKHRTVPIIALTANSSEDNKKRALEAGINDYVVKPYTPEYLYSILLKHVNQAGEKMATKKKINQHSKKSKEGDANEKYGMDLSFLEKYTGGDLKITGQLIELFLREVPDSIEKLGQFIREKKWKEVHAVSHKVKSNFAIFELSELKRITVLIEESSRELVNLEELPELFKTFSNTCAEVLFILEEEYKKLKESKK